MTLQWQKQLQVNLEAFRRSWLKTPDSNGYFYYRSQEHRIGLFKGKCPDGVGDIIDAKLVSFLQVKQTVLKDSSLLEFYLSLFFASLVEYGITYPGNKGILVRFVAVSHFKYRDYYYVITALNDQNYICSDVIAYQAELMQTAFKANVPNLASARLEISNPLRFFAMKTAEDWARYKREQGLQGGTHNQLHLLMRVFPDVLFQLFQKYDHSFLHSYLYLEQKMNAKAPTEVVSILKQNERLRQSVLYHWFTKPNYIPYYTQNEHLSREDVGTIRDWCFIALKWPKTMQSRFFEHGKKTFQNFVGTSTPSGLVLSELKRNFEAGCNFYKETSSFQNPNPPKKR